MAHTATKLNVINKYSNDMLEYEKMGGKVDEIDIIENEDRPTYSIDGQYMFMGLWAYKLITRHIPEIHYDVGSQIEWMMYLSLEVPVKHIDIRDPEIKLQNFEFMNGDITHLPIKDDEIKSLSCLHVAEHIGLGRYGDKIDPNGFKKGCSELERILAPGGVLYFAVPIGKPKTVFNSHRVLGSWEVLEAFPSLRLLQFSGISSGGTYAEDIPVDCLDNDRYGCGMFLFTK